MSVVDEAALAAVRAHMKSVRIPGFHDKVYKDECMFSYDDPESPGGLYVNLATLQVRCVFVGIVCMFACVCWLGV